MFRATLRSLLARKLRLALTALSIVLGFITWAALALARSLAGSTVAAAA